MQNSPSWKAQNISNVSEKTPLTTNVWNANERTTTSDHTQQTPESVNVPVELVIPLLNAQILYDLSHWLMDHFQHTLGKISDVEILKFLSPIMNDQNKHAYELIPFFASSQYRYMPGFVGTELFEQGRSFYREFIIISCFVVKKQQQAWTHKEAIYNVSYTAYLEYRFNSLNTNEFNGTEEVIVMTTRVAK